MPCAFERKLALGRRHSAESSAKFGLEAEVLRVGNRSSVVVFERQVNFDASNWTGHDACSVCGPDTALRLRTRILAPPEVPRGPARPHRPGRRPPAAPARFRSWRARLCPIDFSEVERQASGLSE